jgi:hypothetical protein
MPKPKQANPPVPYKAQRPGLTTPGGTVSLFVFYVCAHRFQRDKKTAQSGNGASAFDNSCIRTL